jgi:hypothetical protein
VITISAESDDELRAVGEAIAEGRVNLGSGVFVIKRERRPAVGAGDGTGATSHAGGAGAYSAYGCAGGGESASPVRWQMPENVYSTPESAWRSPSEIRAMERLPGVPRQLHTCSRGRLAPGEGGCPACDPAWWGPLDQRHGAAG